jgi:hypothetical protein
MGVLLPSMRFHLRSLLNAASITAESLKPWLDVVGRWRYWKVKLTWLAAVVLIAGPTKASLHISAPLQSSLFCRVFFLNVHQLVFLTHLQVISVLGRAVMSHA